MGLCWLCPTTHHPLAMFVPPMTSPEYTVAIANGFAPVDAGAVGDVWRLELQRRLLLIPNGLPLDLMFAIVIML